MSWHAAMLEEQAAAQVRVDHGQALARMETHRRPEGPVVMWTRGYRTAWWDAIRWLLNKQMEFDHLTAGEALTELRKGDRSIYWPIKHSDPHFWADCPGCEAPALIDAGGLCDTCGYEFEGEQT